MLLTLLMIATGFFVSFFVLFFVVLRRSTVESALVEQIAREGPLRDSSGSVPSWRSVLSVDRVARPFGIFRRLFGGKPDPVLIRRLLLAGYRKPAHADIFLGARLALPAVLGIAVASLNTENTILYFLLTIVIAFFIPDLWLGHAVKQRRLEIKLSLPDALDLLAICMEAGLGLDQAVVRVGEELRHSHRELSEELMYISLEQRAGVPRLTAWRSFADRADVESVRSFVGMLVQTDRFGTPISKSLGNFSDALRTQRRQHAEELAAKTTIKLVVPLVLFIFPQVFIVTVAPAVLIILKSMGAAFG
jgi:tight adherence protein C